MAIRLGFNQPRLDLQKGPTIKKTLEEAPKPNAPAENNNNTLKPAGKELGVGDNGTILANNGVVIHNVGAKSTAPGEVPVFDNWEDFAEWMDRRETEVDKACAQGGRGEDTALVRIRRVFVVVRTMTDRASGRGGGAATNTVGYPVEIDDKGNVGLGNPMGKEDLSNLF